MLNTLPFDKELIKKVFEELNVKETIRIEELKIKELLNIIERMR